LSDIPCSIEVGVTVRPEISPFGGQSRSVEETSKSVDSPTHYVVEYGLGKIPPRKVSLLPAAICNFTVTLTIFNCGPGGGQLEFQVFLETPPQICPY
jgi:hypothetical protein